MVDSPDICTFDQIRVLSRVQEIPHEGAFCDLMWSGPDDINNWAVSPRGAGWLFGRSITREVCHPCRLVAVQPCQLPHSHHPCPPTRSGRLQIHVRQRPSHCMVCTQLLLSCGDMASVLTLREGGEHDFKVFGPVPENKKDKGMSRRSPGMQYFM
ncbi:serine/threonine-protein phosphatase 6 catalytic subunit [Pisolithus marmoratus]|nr:serine/threonine-protein phosphatase 6 catalytic subunit [Pisolithus marmoratus]